MRWRIERRGEKIKRVFISGGVGAARCVRSRYLQARGEGERLAARWAQKVYSSLRWSDPPHKHMPALAARLYDTGQASDTFTFN